MRYQRLYLDTNVLEESTWPHISIQLKNVFQICEYFGIEIVVPEACEKEIEEHWIRSILAHHKSANDKYQRLLKRIDSKATISIPEEAALRGVFAQKAASVREAYQIKRASMCAAFTSNLFELAIRRVLPFKDEGKGFQDSVVLMSVLSDLTESPVEHAALITNDDSFTGADLSAFPVKPSGFLEVITAKTVFEQLENEYDTKQVERRTQELLKRWERAKETASKAFEQDDFLDALERKIIDNLVRKVLPSRLLEIVEVQRLRNIKLMNVEIPIDAVKHSGEHKEIVEIEIIALVDAKTTLNVLFGSKTTPLIEQPVIEKFKVEAEATFVDFEVSSLKFIRLRKYPDALLGE